MTDQSPPTNGPYGPGLNITGPSAERTNAEARRIALSHNAAERVTVKTGATTRAAQVDGGTITPQPEPGQARPTLNPGQTFVTSSGLPVEMFQPMVGEPRVKLPGGLEMTLSEAKHHGAIREVSSDGDGQGAPKDGTARTDGPTEDQTEGGTEGDSDGPEPINLETLDVTNEADYEKAANRLGEVFTEAGVDEQHAADAISSAIEEAVSGDGSYELPDAVHDALAAKVGEEGIDVVMDVAVDRFQHVVASAIKDAGLTQADLPTLADHLRSAHGEAAVRQAGLRAALGDPGPLRAMLTRS